MNKKFNNALQRSVHLVTMHLNDFFKTEASRRFDPTQMNLEDLVKKPGYGPFKGRTANVNKAELQNQTKAEPWLVEKFKDVLAVVKCNKEINREKYSESEAVSEALSASAAGDPIVSTAPDLAAKMEFDILTTGLTFKIAHGSTLASTLYPWAHRQVRQQVNKQLQGKVVYQGWLSDTATDIVDSWTNIHKSVFRVPIGKSSSGKKPRYKVDETYQEKDANGNKVEMDGPLIKGNSGDLLAWNVRYDPYLISGQSMMLQDIEDLKQFCEDNCSTQFVLGVNKPSSKRHTYGNPADLGSNRVAVFGDLTESQLYSFQQAFMQIDSDPNAEKWHDRFEKRLQSFADSKLTKIITTTNLLGVAPAAAALERLLNASNEGSNVVDIDGVAVKNFSVDLMKEMKTCYTAINFLSKSGCEVSTDLKKAVLYIKELRSGTMYPGLFALPEDELENKIKGMDGLLQSQKPLNHQDPLAGHFIELAKITRFLEGEGFSSPAIEVRHNRKVLRSIRHTVEWIQTIIGKTRLPDTLNIANLEKLQSYLLSQADQDEAYDESSRVDVLERDDPDPEELENWEDSKYLPEVGQAQATDSDMDTPAEEDSSDSETAVAASEEVSLLEVLEAAGLNDIARENLYSATDQVINWLAKDANYGEFFVFFLTLESFFNASEWKKFTENNLGADDILRRTTSKLTGNTGELMVDFKKRKLLPPANPLPILSTRKGIKGDENVDSVRANPGRRKKQVEYLAEHYDEYLREFVKNGLKPTPKTIANTVVNEYCKRLNNLVQNNQLARTRLKAVKTHNTSSSAMTITGENS